MRMSHEQKTERSQESEPGHQRNSSQDQETGSEVGKQSRVVNGIQARIRRRERKLGNKAGSSTGFKPGSGDRSGGLETKIGCQRDAGVGGSTDRSMAVNRTLAEQLFHAPECMEWKSYMERALYHLSCIFFLLAFMGGSGIHGCIYIFGMMAAGFLGMALWGALFDCGLDIVTWNSILIAFCLVQIAYLIYGLRGVSYGKDYDTLYQTLYQPMHVPINVFKEIVHCSGLEVHCLSADQSYALEGKTPIDRLSLLITGRVKVSLDGQFLHYIFPYQFLDSPEWESLRPSEEGTFQVTLTAEADSTFISWPRKKLYLLLAKEKYIARLFSELLGFDISQKLYALNDKLFAKFGLRFDIRLPSLYHVLEPSQELAADLRPIADHPSSRLLHEDQPPRKAPPPSSRGPRPESGNLGEDSSSLILDDFAELPGSFMDYVSEGEYLK